MLNKCIPALDCDRRSARFSLTQTARPRAPARSSAAAHADPAMQRNDADRFETSMQSLRFEDTTYDIPLHPGRHGARYDGE